MRIRSILRFLAALAMVAGVFAAGLVLRAPARSLPLPPRDGPSIAAAKSWGYQLQNISAGSIPDAIDIMVVDYSRDGGAGRVLTGREVAALKVRSDGSRRIVLCYLSIGEAESYRGYWRETWPAKPPPWLGPENPKWKGNYDVAFWEPAWQRLIVAPDPTGLTLVQRLKSALDPAPYAYLDTIIDAGFDGVLLDRVDAYEAYDKAPEFRALAAANIRTEAAPPSTNAWGKSFRAPGNRCPGS